MDDLTPEEIQRRLALSALAGARGASEVSSPGIVGTGVEAMRTGTPDMQKYSDELGLDAMAINPIQPEVVRSESGEPIQLGMAADPSGLFKLARPIQGIIGKRATSVSPKDFQAVSKQRAQAKQAQSSNLKAAQRTPEEQSKLTDMLRQKAAAKKKPDQVTKTLDEAMSKVDEARVKNVDDLINSGKNVKDVGLAKPKVPELPETESMRIAASKLVDKLRANPNYKIPDGYVEQPIQFLRDIGYNPVNRSFPGLDRFKVGGK